MRSKGNTPTRGEVTDTVEKQREDMSDQIEQLDIIATDTETVRDTLEALDLNGTAEGSEQVESAIEQAESAAVGRFSEEDDTLEQIQDVTEEHEAELQERSDASESDLDKISDAAGKIETQEAAGELENAKEAASSDIEFLKSQEQISRDARAENEQLQQEHRGRVQGGRR